MRCGVDQALGHRLVEPVGVLHGEGDLCSVVALQEGIRSSSKNLGHALHHLVSGSELRLHLVECSLTAFDYTLLVALRAALTQPLMTPLCVALVVPDARAIVSES